MECGIKFFDVQPSKMKLVQGDSREILENLGQIFCVRFLTKIFRNHKPKTYQVMMWVGFWQDQGFLVSFQVEVDHRLGLHEDFEDSNPIF